VGNSGLGQRILLPLGTCYLLVPGPWVQRRNETDEMSDIDLATPQDRRTQHGEGELLFYVWTMHRLTQTSQAKAEFATHGAKAYFSRG
jgi:hypothetical protein